MLGFSSCFSGMDVLGREFICLVTARLPWTVSPGTNRGINLESHLCCLGHFRTNVFPISRNHPHPSPAALQMAVSLSQQVAQPGRARTGMQSGITVESLNN